MAGRRGKKEKDPNAPRARRGRPPKVKPDLSNVTGEQIQAKYNEFTALKAAALDVSNKLKSFKKVVKAMGIEPGDLEWRYKQGQRDPADIDAETRRRNRMARYTALPIGTQLGLLETAGGKPVSVATAIENDHMATGSSRMEQTPDEAEIGGFNAIDAGLTLDKNPWPAEHANHEPWRRGFVRRAEQKADGDAAASSGEDLPAEMAEAEEGGYRSHDLPMPIEDNPYPSDNPRHNAWNRGWRRRAGELGGAGATANGADGQHVSA